MIRDYSDAQKQNLLAMAADVEPDGFFQSVGDWFGDGGLSIKRFFGGYNIDNYLNNMDEYHRAMIDKDDVTAQQINAIFEEVNKVDRLDKLRFELCGTLLGNLTNLITQYANAATSKGITFCDPADLTAIETSADYSAYRSTFVTVFELAHPDIKADMDKAFSDMRNGAWTYDDDGNPLVWHPGVPDDVDYVKFLVYSAEEPYRSLFTDNVANVKVSPTDGGAFYGNNVININWNNPSTMASDPRGPFEPLFHEYGHFLDDTFAEDGYLSDPENFTTSAGTSLQQSIDSDVYNTVWNKTREMYPTMSDEFITRVTRRICYGNLPGFCDNEMANVTAAAQNVQSTMNSDLSTPMANGVSDVYDSSTNYLTYSTETPIPSQYESQNTGMGVSGSYQHGNDYYYNFNVTTNADGTQTMTIVDDPPTYHSGAKEGVATYFAHNMLGWTDYSSYYTDYLPNTTVYYGEVIDYMANN